MANDKVREHLMSETFRAGQYVKVLRGPNAGAQGRIQAQTNRGFFLIDTGWKTITVDPRHLETEEGLRT